MNRHPEAVPAGWRMDAQQLATASWNHLPTPSWRPGWRPAGQRFGCWLGGPASSKVLLAGCQITKHSDGGGYERAAAAAFWRGHAKEHARKESSR
jgi:hypothetical protein